MRSHPRCDHSPFPESKFGIVATCSADWEEAASVLGDQWLERAIANASGSAGSAA
jgi:hypothetical protein